MNMKEHLCQEKVHLFYAKMVENKKLPGPLMPTLHDAQAIFGYIPLSIQKLISEELGESVAKINGVVTFYGNFSVTPKGEHTVSVCLGTACYVRGSKNIMETLENELGIKEKETTKDGKISLTATRCIGACGLAPVFSVDGAIHGNASVSKVRDIVKELKATTHDTN
jgi:NADH:ubiquinone oxidoreductase subunit E